MRAPSRSTLAVVILAAIATLAAACSSDPTPTPVPTSTPVRTPTPTATPAEIRESFKFTPTNYPELSFEELDYLLATEAAWKLFADNNERFFDLFSQTWPLPELLLKALYDAGAGTAFLDTIAALEAIAPPERFRDDHLIVVQRARRAAEVDARIGIAIRDADVLAFWRLNIELGVSQTQEEATLSRHVCIANSQDPRLCGPGGLTPGSYQEQLSVAIRDLEGGLRNTAAVLPPNMGLTPDELMLLAAEGAPKVVALFEDAAMTLKALTPPPALSADHERLAAYLSEVLVLAKNRGDAARARDGAAFEEAGITFVLTRCATADVIESSEFRALVTVHLDGAPPCDGPLAPPT